MHKHILIPTEGSQLSTDALEKALAFAKEIGAKATVLTVVEPFHIFSTNIDQLESTREEYDRHSQQAADRILADAGARARTHGVDCHTTQVTNHEPAKAIIDTAAQPRLRPDRHGIARTRRLHRIHGRQRDDEGARPFKDPGSGLPLMRPGACGSGASLGAECMFAFD
ncbi:universal stress protein [Rhizobium mongolense]|uniref:universal stress protein n=1 Tax=Rhizobium mongolense TaxID=57676 RepID=UPI003F5ECAF9